MGRPKKTEKQTRINLTAKVLPDIEAEVERIGKKHHRTKSSAADMLLLRGLAAYRRDGLLDDPEIDSLIDEHGSLLPVPSSYYSDQSHNKQKPVRG